VSLGDDERVCIWNLIKNASTSTVSLIRVQGFDSRGSLDIQCNEHGISGFRWLIEPIRRPIVWTVDWSLNEQEWSMHTKDACASEPHLLPLFEWMGLNRTLCSERMPRVSDVRKLALVGGLALLVQDDAVSVYVQRYPGSVSMSKTKEE
jgi:hypothetical protein